MTYINNRNSMTNFVFFFRCWWYSVRMHWIVANTAINSDHLRYVNVSSSIRKEHWLFLCLCGFFARSVNMHEFRGSGSNLMTWFRSTADHRKILTHSTRTKINLSKCNSIVWWAQRHFLIGFALFTIFMHMIWYLVHIEWKKQCNWQIRP